MPDNAYYQRKQLGHRPTFRRIDPRDQVGKNCGHATLSLKRDVTATEKCHRQDRADQPAGFAARLLPRRQIRRRCR